MDVEGRNKTKLVNSHIEYLHILVAIDCTFRNGQTLNNKSTIKFNGFANEKKETYFTNVNGNENHLNIEQITDSNIENCVKQSNQFEVYSLKIRRYNKPTGDGIDIKQIDELMDVKKSYSTWSGEMNQLNMFIASSIDDLLIPNKKVILYIDEELTTAQKSLITNSISNKVKLVNSLSELQSVLKFK